MVWIHQAPFRPLHTDTFNTNINPANYEHSIIYDSTYLTYSTKITSWTPLTICCLLENIQYGMPQSQHYNFGWQTFNLTILSDAIE